MDSALKTLRATNLPGRSCRNVNFSTKIGKRIQLRLQSDPDCLLSSDACCVLSCTAHVEEGEGGHPLDDVLDLRRARTVALSEVTHRIYENCVY